MQKINQVIVEHDFHPETVEELHMLRDIRLALAHKQLANLDDTIKQLVDRKLIASNDIEQTKIELRNELLERISMLEGRDEESAVHADEISLYVDLI